MIPYIPIPESKGMRAIFQKKGKKGQKIFKKSKKRQNTWKFSQKCTKFENILKKSRWLRAVIARNILLKEGPGRCYFCIYSKM